MVATVTGRRYLVLAAAGVAVAVLGACASPSGSDASASAQQNLGQDLLGEQCHATPRPAKSVDAGLTPPTDIFCGSSKHPSGAYSLASSPSVPPEPDARLKAIETAAHGSAFGRDQDQRLACQPGRWSKTDGGVDILVQSCTLKDGGWPYLTIAAVNGGHLIVAEGTAAVVPLISQVIDGRPAASASTASGSAEDKAAKIARLEALLGSTPNLYATGDLDTYKSLVELARLYEGLQNYAGAERAYLQALQIQSRILPADNPAIGETLLEVALAVSNQGRAEEADALFNRADLLI